MTDDRVDTNLSLMLDALALPWIKCDDPEQHTSHRHEPEPVSLAFCAGVAR